MLVLRVWFEPEPARQPLRARIVTDTKPANERDSSIASASVDEVVEHVRAWIEEFVASRAGRADP